MGESIFHLTPQYRRSHGPKIQSAGLQSQSIWVFFFSPSLSFLKNRIFFGGGGCFCEQSDLCYILLNNNNLMKAETLRHLIKTTQAKFSLSGKDMLNICECVYVCVCVLLSFSVCMWPLCVCVLCPRGGVHNCCNCLINCVPIWRDTRTANHLFFLSPSFSLSHSSPEVGGIALILH